MNTLLSFPLDDLTGLRLCLFEEAKSYSLAEPNDVLVNRKGSALRPKCHAIASDILSLATSILNHEAVPRSLLRNGKRSFQDLTAWRASEKCTDKATAASQEANAYSQQQSTLTREQSQHRRLEVTPMPTAQSIASVMIAKDVYELKTKMDDLQRRMSRVESLSSPAIIKNELQQIKSVVSNMSAMQTQKPEHHNVTTETQTTNSHVLSRQLLDERPVNQSSPAAAHSLSVATWNCRGLSNGIPYIEHLANSHNVIVVSEHWLWPFELHKLNDIHPNMTGLAIADKRLNPESNLVRGCGGIGILWNKHLDATPVSGIESDRICALNIKSTTCSTLIIGVYLPTTDAPIDDFHLCLHTLESLINNHSGPVVIAGDFNCHVGQEGGPRATNNPNHQGDLLLEMVQNNDLFFTSLSNVTSGPAYTYFNGNTRTTTDYIIMNASYACLVLACEIHDHHPLNFSDHLPLSLTLSTTPTESETSKSTNCRPRLNWQAASADGSIQAYVTHVNNIIRPHLGKAYNSISSIEEEICSVSTSILHAAMSTIPKQKQKKNKKLFTSNPELRDLSKKSKSAWKNWKRAGCPYAGPEYEEKKRLARLTKQCANKCRASVDRKSWKKREKMFRSKDPKRFRTPSNKPSLGNRLLYEGQIISDPDTIRSCWSNHFTQLFQPQSNSNSNPIDHQRNLEFLSRMNHDNILDEDFTIEEIEASLGKLKPGKAGGIDGLQSEHLKFGGPLLTIWLKQIFCAFIKLEKLPPSLLTGIICPIYKGKGKDPLSCHSYRGITITSVITKVFEYTILDRLIPVLQDSGHPLLTQTAYQKGISCQDAIFATQEAILHNLSDGRVSYLSLYDLEKAFDSVEHSVLLKSLFEAGINGKAWRLIQACYSNLTAVVKSGSALSAPFPVSRGVQQGSVLSPTFFLVVMDKLLLLLKESSAGLSIGGLYLGGASHADDVRAIASSASAAEEQSQFIQNFAIENGLKLNHEKTEIVRISQSKSSENHQLQILDLTIETVPHATCLGYTWSHNLSAKQGVEANINKARRQFFALGSSGGFLGHSNPLSAKEVFETCVIPTLLYGAENWILDEGCLELLEHFQAEIGRRILKLSRYHSGLAVQIGLSLPSVTARVLIRKISYLHHLLSSTDESIAISTFRILASQDVQNISLVKQCIFWQARMYKTSLLSNSAFSLTHC